MTVQEFYHRRPYERQSWYGPAECDIYWRWNGDSDMNDNQESNPSRRDFCTRTGRGAAVSALGGVALPQVHAAGSDTINVALVGCGGRGTGAAQNALGVKN